MTLGPGAHPDSAPSEGRPPGGGEGFDPAYAVWRAKSLEWWTWHRENPMIWEYFQDFAKEAIERKRTKISHWLIVNRIRWEVFISTTGVIRIIDGEPEEFKISNDHIAFYARLWKHCYPEHKHLFTTKRMIGEPADSPLIGS